MKMIHLKATTMNISSEGIAKIYRDDIWKLHRVPSKILSNRGPQFTSKFIEEFTKALGTKRQLSTVMGIQTLTIFILFYFIFSDFTFLLLYFIFLERQ